MTRGCTKPYIYEWEKPGKASIRIINLKRINQKINESKELRKNERRQPKNFTKYPAVEAFKYREYLKMIFKENDMNLHVISRLTE